MTSRTRMNVYFSPDLLKQVEGLALRRNVSKSAVIEAAVASFLSGDTTERLEAAMSRRLDKLGRQFDMLDEDVAILGETLSLFVQFWLTMTPPLSDSAKQSARIKGNEYQKNEDKAFALLRDGLTQQVLTEKQRPRMSV